MKTVSFNKTIYQPESIFNEAVNAYSDLATIQVTSEKDRYVVEFQKTKYDSDKTADEFCNYVLLLMQRNVWTN